MQEARLACGRIRDGAHDEGKRILELDHTWAWAGRAPFGCLAQPSLIPCFPSFSPKHKGKLELESSWVELENSQLGFVD